ncbi:MAG: hypothetical protein K2X99_04855 [Gemmatimonadaceae bacterium]|nr:hypothetical protein [Gemmatimonadaceae bacterium]
MNSKLSFALICATALAFACGPRSKSSELLAHHSAAKNGGVHAALNVDVRDGVTFAMHVTNDGAKKVELAFNSGQTHDIVVLDSLGRETWRWSTGRLFTQALQNKVLRTADTLAIEERWRATAPGRYTVIATLASANFPLEQRTEFVVP